MVSEAVRYARTRLLRWRMLALWLLVVGTLWGTSPWFDAAALMLKAGFLALAIALLRLWDDLADLAADRHRHPERVLVTSANLQPFWITLIAGLLLMPLAFAADTRLLVIYAALLLALGLLYHSRVGAALPRPVRSYLILAKYPLLLLLAGAQPSSRTFLAGLTLYLLLGAYEWWDDNELRVAPAGQVLAGGVTGVAVVSLLTLPIGRML